MRGDTPQAHAYGITDRVLQKISKYQNRFSTIQQKFAKLIDDINIKK